MTALLKLYPAAFRREFGDEIAEAYREATHGAGRAARVREALDVTGHALRMRLGLSSARRPGRLVAALAPFAAVAVGAHVIWWMGLILATAGAPDLPGEFAVPYVLLAAACFVIAQGAAIALGGRWAAGTWTMLTGFVAMVLLDLLRSGGGLAGTVFFRTPLLLVLLVALLCPADLRPQPRIRTAAGLGAVALWTTLLTAALTLGPLPDGAGGLRFAVPAAAGLALAGRQTFARLRTAPAVLLAALPFFVLGMTVWSGDVYTGPALLGLLLITAVTVSIRRRRGGRNPATEA
ncbi:hypothetical protein ACFXDJ_06590 [Streptomyces sp. NPDC059443]|uniref:hypothetical protein n=1 Tax=unclassified Streptomyces TaxID=2593676 RepID=UPI003691685B